MAALEVLDLFGGMIARHGCWSLGQLEHARLFLVRRGMRRAGEFSDSGMFDFTSFFPFCHCALYFCFESWCTFLLCCLMQH